MKRWKNVPWNDPYQFGNRSPVQTRTHFLIVRITDLTMTPNYSAKNCHSEITFSLHWENLTFSCCVHYHRISEPIRLTFIFVTHEINNKERRRNNKETKTTVKTHNATLCVWLKGKRRFRWINNSRLNIVLRWTHKKGKSTTRRKTFFFVSVVTNIYIRMFLCLFEFKDCTQSKHNDRWIHTLKMFWTY